MTDTWTKERAALWREVQAAQCECEMVKHTKVGPVYHGAYHRLTEALQAYNKHWRTPAHRRVALESTDG